MARFWFKWTLGSILGFVVGFAGPFLLIGLATGDEGPEAYGIPFEVAFPVIIGLAAGAMATVQFLILRRRIVDAGRWIPTTAMALLIGIGVLVVLTALMGDPETAFGSAITGAFHGAVVGAIVGGAQGWVLRRGGSRTRWLLVNLVALTAAGAIGDTVAFYTDGATGTMVIFFLWQAFVAIPLYRMTSDRADRRSSAETMATAG